MEFRLRGEYILNNILMSVLIITFLINIPFGYWRAYAKNKNDKKEWILAIHIPVPLVFLMRFLSGSGIKLIPVFVFFFFSGQFVGGKLFSFYSKRIINPTRCIYIDTRDYLKVNKK